MTIASPGALLVLLALILCIISVATRDKWPLWPAVFVLCVALLARLL
jgi:hypothetical protein